MTRAAAGILLICSICAASGAEMTLERKREVLADALRSFDEAVEAARGDSARARELYRRAAAGFETLIDADARNAMIEYDLANAYARMDEPGRAILHYRRALRQSPRNAEISANLAYVRKGVVPSIAETDERKLVRSLFFWHYGSSAHARLLAAAVLSVVGWLLLAVRLGRRRAPLRWAGVTAVAFGLICCASLTWQIQGRRASPPAVVIEGEHVLRLGKGEGSDAAMSAPLGAGVELRIVETHADWVKVRLRDGRSGWLPAAAIEQI